MDFGEYIDADGVDVLCLGETKIDDSLVPGFKDLLKAQGLVHSYFACAEKKGYSGTAVFSRIKPVSVSYGIGVDALDNEGRVITVEFDDFYVVNTYVPNSGAKLVRLDQRTKEWDPAMLKLLQSLDASKPVVWTGDLNVAHLEIDIHDPKGNRNKSCVLVAVIVVVVSVLFCFAFSLTFTRRQCRLLRRRTREL